MEQGYYSKDRAGYYREGFLAHDSISSKEFYTTWHWGPLMSSFGGIADKQRRQPRPARPSMTQSERRSKSSDNRSEQFADTGGESHRQRAPERNSDHGAQDLCTANFCPDRTQKSEKAQRRSEHDRNKCARGRYDNHKQGHRRTYRKRCGRGQCGLYRTRGGGFRNPKLIAGVGA